jgi:hypothetical protein
MGLEETRTKNHHCIVHGAKTLQPIHAIIAMCAQGVWTTLSRARSPSTVIHCDSHRHGCMALVHLPAARSSCADGAALRRVHFESRTCTDCTVPRGCMHGAGSRKGPLEIMAALTSLLRCDRGLLRWPRRLTPAARRTAPTGRDADARRAPVRARRLVKSSQVKSFKSFKIRAL